MQLACLEFRIRMKTSRMFAGVKLVLPALLKGVEDKAWRTKQGSVQLLGAMAYCAPKQLSQALPTIVPRLSSVLTDPHPRVQSTARAALVEVGVAVSWCWYLVLTRTAIFSDYHGSETRGPAFNSLGRNPCMEVIPPLTVSYMLAGRIRHQEPRGVGVGAHAAGGHCGPWQAHPQHPGGTAGPS